MDFGRLIAFTKAQEKSDLWENGEQRRQKSSGHNAAAISGEEAKSFYESLLANEGRPSSRKKPPPKRRRVASPSRERAESQSWPAVASPGAADPRSGHQLLKCAQDGDLAGLKRLLDKDLDINFQDGYYWTALMSAAYAGKKEVVRHLLGRGAAWVGVCETTGKDAWTLAEEAGHQDIVQILQESLRERPPAAAPRACPPPERQYCAVCRTHYQEDSQATHQRSTVHLFNSRKKLPPTYYAIPEHNIGYRMMLKEGWDSEAGLGPSGTGRRFPVQTVLKRDQKGLGFQSNEKPKVTHFAANDTAAVARPELRHKRMERVTTVSRKEARRREARAKAWERDLRTYMNID